MHISDGILDARICIGGYAAAALLAGYALRNTGRDDIPRISVMGAVFFVSSLIHFRIGPSSVHLLLVGITGIILGPMCPLAFLTGFFFQALMFGHGGITTLGVNTAIFSVSALLVYHGFSGIRRISRHPAPAACAAGMLSGAGVFAAAGLVLAVIYFSAREFAGIAVLFSISHAALALTEGVVSGMITAQLLRIKPGVLAP